MIKKLFIAALVLTASVLMVVGSATAQYQIDSNSVKTNNGKREYAQNADSLRLNGVSIKKNAITAQFTYNLNVNAVDSTLSFTDTVNVLIDTVSRHLPYGLQNSVKSRFYSWWNPTIAANDDTIEVSAFITFPEDKTTTLLPGESYTPKNPYSIKAIDNLYVRRKGTTGTATFRLFAEGL